MEFVYQDEGLVARAPNLFAPFFVKETDRGATLDDVLAAVRGGETVTIRQPTPIEAAWAEELLVIYELAQELAIRREMLYMGLIQYTEGINPDVVVDRFQAAGIESEALAHGLVGGSLSMGEVANGAA